LLQIKDALLEQKKMWQFDLWRFLKMFLNFSELFELTLTDPQLAPPSGETFF
jgi:hypothetical protein